MAAAAISVTISQSFVFDSSRNWICEKSEFFGKLITCPYCTTHWVCFVLMISVPSAPVTAEYFTMGFPMMSGITIWMGLVGMSSLFIGAINKAIAQT